MKRFNMSKYFAVSLDGKILVHLPDADRHGNYYTLCGLDGDDPVIRQTAVDVPVGAKVNCRQCWAIWNKAKKYSKKDFVANISVD
jgi:hypothetical protein